MLLPEQLQQQLIRNFVGGLDPAPEDIKHLTDPYDWLYEYLGKVDNPDRRYVLLSQLIPQDNEWRDVVEPILNLNPGEKERFKTIKEVGDERPPITWLWKNWVPRGYLSMLAGYPSAGKTFFGLNLIHLIAMGLAAPDVFVKKNQPHFLRKNSTTWLI